MFSYLEHRSRLDTLVILFLCRLLGIFDFPHAVVPDMHGCEFESRNSKSRNKHSTMTMVPSFHQLSRCLSLFWVNQIGKHFLHTWTRRQHTNLGISGLSSEDDFTSNIGKIHAIEAIKATSDSCLGSIFTGNTACIPRHP